MRQSTGFFSLASTCPTCRGDGHIIENPCPDCGGSGAVKKRQKIVVTIPAGVENGRQVALRGQGDAGPNGGPSGDLYVFIRVQHLEYFERQGADLYCAAPVSITQAALGCEIQVATLDNKTIKVKVPPGSPNGKLLRVPGEGVPVSGRRGDFYIKLMVKVPERISKRGRELLEEFSKLEGENEHPSLIPLSKIE